MRRRSPHGVLVCLTLLTSWGLDAVRAAPMEWHYRGVGKDVAPEIASTTLPGRKGAPWRAVSLPHCFDTDQSMDHVNAWYAADITIPLAWASRGLILDLGPMDDADETFLNGHSVGRTGDPDETDPVEGSAWNRDRLYLVPAEHVTPGGNVVTVRVKDFTGLGGFMGQAHVGALLCTALECRFQAQDGPVAAMASPAADDSKWTVRSLPLCWEAGRSSGEGRHAWYRFRFDLPESVSGRSLPVDLGRVYDAAEVYLNGHAIGRIGSLGSNGFRQTAARLRVILPKERLLPAGNVLAVRAYGPNEDSQLVGAPSVVLSDVDLFDTDEPLRERMERPNALDALAPDRRLDLCEYLVHSGMAAVALAVCDSIETESADLKHRARALRVYALWLSGRGRDAWDLFRSLDFTRPIPYSAATAMSAYCRRRNDADNGVLYAGRDLQTRGDWVLRYGMEHAILCAMHSPYDAQYGLGPRMLFSVTAGDQNETARAWLGAPETEDMRALYLPETACRRYASWDDRGETHPFDERGPDLVVDVNVPEGAHLLSLYFVDWDWYLTSHPRAQSILVMDYAGRPIHVVSTGRFGQGHYERFVVEGPRPLSLRIVKHRSPCVVLSGVFLDGLPPLMPYPMAGLDGMPASDRLLALRRRFESFREASRQSLTHTLCSEDYIAFEAEALSEALRSRDPEAFWWAAECKRLRSNFERADDMLVRCFDALRGVSVSERRKAAFARVGRLFGEKRLRAEQILTAMQYAAWEMGDGAEQEYGRMVEQSGMGYLRRAADLRWQQHPQAGPFAAP